MAIGTAGFTFPFTQGLGYQQFSAVSTAIQLGTTAPSTGPTAIPAGATYCVISIETNAARWRDDGSAPTAAIGMPVAAGSSFSFQGIFSNLQLIPETGSFTVNVWYGK